MKSSGSSACVFQVQFGDGSLTSVDRNKLTLDFAKAQRKMVLDRFVQKAKAFRSQP